MTQKMPTAIVVGGPAGTGKTTTAQLLAQHYLCPFLEGDDLHPQENVDKMARGEPLTDEDRWGWLEQLGKEAAAKSCSSDNHSGICVASCSMLKKVYRQYLQQHCVGAKMVFVFLHTFIERLQARVAARKGHFMKLTMVQLQFDIMEVPCGDELCGSGGNAIAVEMSDMTPSEVELYILERLPF